MATETVGGSTTQLCALPRMDFSSIRAPGVYVTHRTGLLVRVLPEALAGGQNVPITITGRTPVWVYQLSGDPWLPTQQARSAAANHDVYVNF